MVCVKQGILCTKWHARSAWAQCVPGAALRGPGAALAALDSARPGLFSSPGEGVVAPGTPPKGAPPQGGASAAAAPAPAPPRFVVVDGVEGAEGGALEDVVTALAAGWGLAEEGGAAPPARPSNGGGGVVLVLALATSREALPRLLGSRALSRLRLEELQLPSERQLLLGAVEADLLGPAHGDGAAGARGARAPLPSPALLALLGDLAEQTDASAAGLQRLLGAAREAFRRRSGTALLGLADAAAGWRGGAGLRDACAALPRATLEEAWAGLRGLGAGAGAAGGDHRRSGREARAASASRLAEELEAVARAWHGHRTLLRVIHAAARATGFAHPPLPLLQLAANLGCRGYVEEEFLTTTDPARRPIFSRLLEQVRALREEEARGLLQAWKAALAHELGAEGAGEPGECPEPLGEEWGEWARRLESLLGAGAGPAGAAAAAAAGPPAEQSARMRSPARGATREKRSPVVASPPRRIRGLKTARGQKAALEAHLDALSRARSAKQQPGAASPAAASALSAAVAEALSAAARRVLGNPWVALPAAPLVALLSEREALEVREMLQPSPWLDTEGALRHPGDALGCTCCSRDGGTVPEMEDAAVAFRLLEECRDGVGASDWFKDFCHVHSREAARPACPVAKAAAKVKKNAKKRSRGLGAVDGAAEAENPPPGRRRVRRRGAPRLSEAALAEAAAEAQDGGAVEEGGAGEGGAGGQEEKEVLMARFMRAVAELQHVGLVRRNKRRRGGEYFQKTVLDIGRVF